MLTLAREAFIDAVVASIPPLPAGMSDIFSANLCGVVPEPSQA